MKPEVLLSRLGPAGGERRRAGAAVGDGTFSDLGRYVDGIRYIIYYSIVNGRNVLLCVLSSDAYGIFWRPIYTSRLCVGASAGVRHTTGGSPDQHRSNFLFFFFSAFLPAMGTFVVVERGVRFGRPFPPSTFLSNFLCSPKQSVSTTRYRCENETRSPRIELHVVLRFQKDEGLPKTTQSPPIRCGMVRPRGSRDFCCAPRGGKLTYLSLT